LLFMLTIVVVYADYCCLCWLLLLFIYLQELPKIMCATKTVKSNSGDKFSVEEKEILLVRGVTRVPGSKKKKVFQNFHSFRNCWARELSTWPLKH